MGMGWPQASLRQVRGTGQSSTMSSPSRTETICLFSLKSAVFSTRLTIASTGASTAFSCFMMETLNSSSPSFTMSPGCTYITHRSPLLGAATWNLLAGSAMVMPRLA